MHARFTLVLTLMLMTLGCTSDTGGPGTATGTSSKNSAAPPPPEPKPIAEIALLQDSSYESAKITEGTTVGEVREFTTLKIPFCWCPPGQFKMGSDPNLVSHMLNEEPYDVTLNKGFWLQRTELTQTQYEALMGVNPAFFPGASSPVDSVSWNNATEYCRRLTSLPPESKLGNVFRLPTEAEWEYACRAGSTTEFCYGDDPAELVNYGWINANSQRTTHPVGEKQPNVWGLHDMHGNVAEWCQDWYGPYPTTPATDPQGQAEGEARVLRGGGWFYDSSRARSAFRDANGPSSKYVGLGFRLVAVPQ